MRPSLVQILEIEKVDPFRVNYVRCIYCKIPNKLNKILINRKFNFPNNPHVRWSTYLSVGYLSEVINSIK